MDPITLTELELCSSAGHKLTEKVNFYLNYSSTLYFGLELVLALVQNIV